MSFQVGEVIFEARYVGRIIDGQYVEFELKAHKVKGLKHSDKGTWLELENETVATNPDKFASTPALAYEKLAEELEMKATDLEHEATHFWKVARRASAAAEAASIRAEVKKR